MRALSLLLLAAVLSVGGFRFYRNWQDSQRTTAATARLAAQAQKLRSEIDALKAAPPAATLPPASEPAPEDLQKARDFVAALRRDAATRRAATQTANEKFAENRDPEKDFVLVGNFADKGRNSASDAFQTAIWAIQHSPADATRAFAVTPEIAQGLREEWAKEAVAKSQFPDPDSILIAMFASDFLDNDAFQIESAVDTGDRATVSILRHKNNTVQQPKKIPFVRWQGGWALEIPPSLVRNIPSYIEHLKLEIAPR